MKSLRVIVLLAFCLKALSSLAQDCSQILRGGIYDVYQNSSATDRAASFVNWFKQKQFSSYQEAKNTSLDIGIPIGDILAGLGFSNDEQGFSQFSNEINSYTSSSTSFKQNLSNKISTINPQVVAAWDHCITQPGLHFWLERTDDPKTFYICAKYMNDGPGKNPYLRNFNIGNVQPAKLGGPFINTKGQMMHVTFSGNRLSQLFTIKDIYEPV